MLMKNVQDDLVLPYEVLERRIAIEAVSITSTLEIFKRIIKGAIESSLAAFPGLQRLAESRPDNFRLKDFEKTLKQLEELNFLQYEDELVTVPEGFHGKMVDFVRMMLVIQPQLHKECQELLSRFEKELSLLLTNKDERLTNKSNDLHYNNLKRHRESYEKQVKPFFNAKYSGLSRQKLGDTYERFSDIREALRLVDQLRAIETTNYYSTIQAHVTGVSDLLKLVRERLDDDSIDQVSVVVAKNIGRGAYELGRMIEMIAIYGYLAENTIAAVHNTAVAFKKLVETPVDKK